MGVRASVANPNPKPNSEPYPEPHPHSGDASPFVMFRGSPFSHLMIPMPGFYDYGAGGTTSTAVAPRMVGEPKAKAAAARGAGSQVSQYK